MKMLSVPILKWIKNTIPPAVVALIVVCTSLHTNGMQLEGNPGYNMPVPNGIPGQVPNMATSAAPPGPSADNFAGTAPVMTFVDPNNQPYGRYVVNETVPSVGYTYEPVTEKHFVARTVTEPRTITQTQYTPVYSYQPQLKNVSSWNPFEQPRQVWEYVPIVHYQPSFVPVTQNVTYQKYEEQNVTKMIPVPKFSEQRTKYVDRPIASLPPGGNMISSVPISNPGTSNVYNANVIQQGALVAQANRNTTQLPTRPIQYPTNNGAYPGNASFLASAPSPYYPPAGSAYGMNQPMANSGTSVAQAAPYSASSTTTLIPAVPVQPGYNANVYPNSYAANPYSANPYSANGYQQPGYYQTAYVAPIQIPAFLNWQGSLFGSSAIANSPVGGSPSTTYVASNTPVSQPYLWGPSSQSASGFRPTTSPYSGQAAYGAPQTTWGMSPSETYRDPMQGGMQPTELR
jgi:hypothetical protein